MNSTRRRRVEDRRCPRDLCFRFGIRTFVSESGAFLWPGSKSATSCIARVCLEPVQFYRGTRTLACARKTSSSMDCARGYCGRNRI